ncbi:WhiB family transcriptional regulator [Streptomyces sp. NPDC026673]|uniref:WhiB family transcriptional regulator n=1 Tax=Streptomyces sp. NPDC026673 TaxID=3155724 RepID=UPI0033EB83CC
MKLDVVQEPGTTNAADESVVWVDNWGAQAICRMDDPDVLFAPGAAQKRVKALCGGCPVRTECLADALDNRIEFGVWGGMTERERRALLRRRPTVTSWRTLLRTARQAYERRPERASA